jgi:hypothetical protein
MSKRIAATIAALAIATTTIAPLSAEAHSTRIASKMVRGTNLKAEAHGKPPTNPVCSSAARQSMRDWKQLGGTSISLVIPLVQDTMTSHIIERREDTAADWCLRVGILNARAEGLTVHLDPLLEVRHGIEKPTKAGGHFLSTWRGGIKPDDKKAWEDQWDYWMGHYVIIAKETGARSMTIGTEMIGVTNTQADELTALVKTLHKKAPGVRIGYAAVWGEPDDLPTKFVRSLDDFGVTLYPKLDIDGQLTESKVSKATGRDFTKGIKKARKKFGHDITVFEFGFRSRKGTHTQTADGTKGGTVSIHEQAVLYSGMLDYLNSNDDIAGFYTWQTNTDPKSGGDHDNGYTTQNKAETEKVLDDWMHGKRK